MMRILGLDGGIASIGWAIIDLDADQDEGRIAACGTRMFNAPEGQSSTGAPVLKNRERRGHRGARHVVRRRRQRMARLRRLFAKRGLLETAGRDALAGHGTDPWELRAQALERALGPRELALALGHIARHRGFKSNRKGESRSNRADDASKMLSAIDATTERLARYRTVGQMFARDPAYAQRKRNREGDYTRSVLRDDQAREVQEIFRAQRAFGNALATEILEKEFMEIAFFQRPLQSSLDLVGDCQFLAGEKRASSFAPSFEKFRFLSKLVVLRIVSGRSIRPLTAEEIRKAQIPYGASKSYSYKALKKAIGLDDTEGFDRVGADRQDRDFVSSKGAAKGTKTLTDLLEPIIGKIETQRLLAQGTPFDAVMAVIAFNEDMGEIRTGLDKAGLPVAAVEAVEQAVREGQFDFVKGTGHICAAAARRLNLHLEKGLRYDEACAAEGWDHAAHPDYAPENIKSPVAQKAAREMLRQVRALERIYGPFDRINIEMARDVGKSIEERGKIEKGIKRRTEERYGAEKCLKELLKIDHVSSEDILRYELWKEQNGRCLYTGQGIAPQAVLASDNSLQVDHILPFSRFGDNSFLNKTLCLTSANQKKGNRTPFEWKDADDPADWGRFSAEVESCKSLKGIKKRNYLLMNAGERQEQFLARNLNDTRYALRVVLGVLQKMYADMPDGPDKTGTQQKRRRVFARPGSITAALRRAWGVESLKKDEKGKRRNDDRHHALDAIITACCSEALLHRATRHAKRQEQRGEKFELRNLPPPWGDVSRFRREVAQAITSVFVSRPETGRLRGKAHDAMIRQIREVDGEAKLFERKAVHDLKTEDLARIPVPVPHGKVRNPAGLRDQMAENLREWIGRREALKRQISDIKKQISAMTGTSEEKTALPEERKALQEQLKALVPRSPKGDVIRKVRLETKDKKAILIRGGSAARDSMVRVDVFAKANQKGVEQYYLVPIYRNDIYTADGQLKENPPNRAVKGGVPESEWPVMDASFAFRFSLHLFSLIEIRHPREDKPILGYFRKLDRSTGAIAISRHENSSAMRKGIGAKNLRHFRKFQVDHLGCYHEIKQETRTWRGKACT